MKRILITAGFCAVLVLVAVILSAKYRRRAAAATATNSQIVITADGRIIVPPQEPVPTITFTYSSSNALWRITEKQINHSNRLVVP